MQQQIEGWFNLILPIKILPSWIFQAFTRLILSGDFDASMR
jgi:hypothetical protein